MPSFDTPGPGNRAIEEQPPKEPAVDASLIHSVSIEELQTRNRTQSPLLRLPCEILIHILLFTIDDMKHTPARTTTLPTCRSLQQVI